MEGQRVLAVECNWRIRKLIRANLEAMGFAVHEAVSGQHALQMISQSKPDLILVDLDAPGMDALALLSTIQVLLAGRPAPIVAMCGEPLDRHLIQQGPPLAGFLQKPFSAPRLMEQVQTALNGGTGCSPAAL
jgi:CheY-like chemotaxis protein